METDTYPNIVLSTSNPEIDDCNLFPAFVGLFADFMMKDGTHFPYADVIAYENGAFVLAIGEHAHSKGFTVIAPISSIETITYI